MYRSITSRPDRHLYMDRMVEPIDDRHEGVDGEPADPKAMTAGLFPFALPQAWCLGRRNLMNMIGNERNKLGRHRAVPGRKVSVERLEAAFLKVAHLATCDIAFAPIFERLEAELDLARKEAKAMTGAQ